MGLSSMFRGTEHPKKVMKLDHLLSLTHYTINAKQFCVMKLTNLSRLTLSIPSGVLKGPQDSILLDFYQT